MALSMSPSASSSAFLVSTMPVPSCSRSALMSAMLMFAMFSAGTFFVEVVSGGRGLLGLGVRFALGDELGGVRGGLGLVGVGGLLGLGALGWSSGASADAVGAAASAAACSPSPEDWRSSCSHSASGSAGSAPSSGFWWRWIRPSAAASATMRVSRPTERMASSLPGIGYWTSSGSQLVSRMPMTGMPSFLASSIARCSFLVSTTQSALGVFDRLRMPPSDLCSLSSSRFLISSSFLVKPLVVPSKSSSSSSFMRASRLDTVWKLVSRPPSQRWFT